MQGVNRFFLTTRSKILLTLSFVVAVTVITVMLLHLYWKSRPKADLSEIEKANNMTEPIKIKVFGWVVHSSSTSVNNFYKYHDKFVWVSPTWYYVDGNGGLIDRGVKSDFIKNCREWGIKLIPLVANYEFSREIIHRILTIPEVREKAIENIVKEVLEKEYDGINIDFENIPSEDRDHLTEFMRLLYEKMHAHGKLVTQAVGAGYVYDHENLAKYNDLIIIMAYGYHWSGSAPGPIAPLYWLNDLIDNLLRKVPKEKLVLGVPLYGFDWPPQGRASAVTYEDAIWIANHYGVKVTFDWKSGEATFKYKAVDGVHEVWFQIAKSIELRIKLAKEKGLDKIAVWRVGQEDPKTWSVIIRPEG